MEPTDQQLRLARILEKNKVYEGLSANPDFAKWREEIVDEQIQFLLDELTSTDRSQPDWKEKAADRLVAYQETVRVYETLFNQKVSLARRTRETLKHIEVSS